MGDDSSSTTQQQSSTVTAKTQKSSTSSDDSASDASSAGISEIVVTGVRASLEDALKAKRDSDQVLDGISAEDIGKLPDKNVGEALQRVTGVTISRENGEGSTINVRGITSSLVRVEFNGSTALSTNVNGGREVDTRDFPSEFVSRVEVVKSQTADMTEGGLGGVVRIISRKPLDGGGKDFYAASAEGTHSNLTNDYVPRLSAFVGHSWLNNTFGLLGGVVYEKKQANSHQFRSTGWIQPDDYNGSGTDDFVPYIPRDVIVRENNKRLAFNGIAQWKPTHDLEFYLEGMYTQRDYDKDDQFLQINTIAPAIDTSSLQYFGDNETVSHYDMRSDLIDSSNTAAANGVPIYDRSLIDTFRNHIYSTAIGGNWEHGPWSIKNRVNYSAMSYDQVSTGPYAAIFNTPEITVDMNNKYRAPNFDFHDTDILDPTSYNYAGVSITPREFRQYQFTAKSDVDYILEKSMGPVTVSSLEWGIEYSRYHVSSNANKSSVSLDGRNDPDVLATIQDSVASYGRLSPQRFFKTKGVGFTTPNWYRFNQDFVDAIGGNDAAQTVTTANVWEINELTTAGYLKANYDFDTYFPIRGNVGVRVVDTDVNSSGYNTSTGTPTSSDGGYTKYLPSGGLVMTFIPHTLMLKTSAAKLMARPEPYQEAPTLSVDTDTSTATRGNTDLKPYSATQYDMSFEWYPASLSYASFGVFYEDVSSFIQTVNVNETLPNYGDTVFSISEPENNGAGVKIKGIEVGGQLDLAEALGASFLDGFGFIANYTYAKDSGTPNISPITGKNLPFEGLSKSSYNITGYYEDHGLSVRLAYNWRDKFLKTTVGRGNLPEFQEAYGQLDGSVSYEIVKGVNIYANAMNLTNSLRFENSSSKYRRNYVETDGSRYSAGVRVKF
ncbi:TonB-dependent receptor [Solimonas marina]|uniref:TonB-dependent receptor n=1 Tax=Solimonas marina TaxID=2714601 RepID=A0A970BA75_9GAMM|nr:TonB-dependent receptor [Solimonas marina]NKF24099.1 TonB-dependent receptor [Solimonas marina]